MKKRHSNSKKTNNEEKSKTKNLDQSNTRNIDIEIINKLNNIERQITESAKSDPQKNQSCIFQLLKLTLSSWPAFGLIFLLIFFFPINNAIKSLSEKVKSANEIQVAGMSLKSKIETVASKKGIGKIAENLSELSSNSIELLLKAPRESKSLFSYSSSVNRQKYIAINLPSEKSIKSIQELIKNGLIELEGGFGKSRRLNSSEFAKLIKDVKEKMPGKKTDRNDNEISWEFDIPIDPNQNKSFFMRWKLSDTGVKTVDIIINIVSDSIVSPKE
jgi:hypothetical protein